MNKTILSILLLANGCFAAAAQDTQEALPVDTLPAEVLSSSSLVLPESFDIDTSTIFDNWYIQRYAVLDSLARTADVEPPTDEVYIERLQKLPTVIEMPFNEVVKSCIEAYVVKRPALVEKVLGLSLYYMPIFEEALEKYQLPLELKYLPIVESALNPNAVSRTGASGLWQFMPTTAQGEGLEVNSLVDQRRDPIASSDAAAHYLLTLYNMYNDWNLAIAAYNCGPGNVNKAIKQAGDRTDYWQIYNLLPKETRGYLPAFIAANYMMSYYASHGISHTLIRRPLVTDTVHVNRKVHFQQISDVLDIPIEELRELNPQYRQDIIPGHIKPYTLVLPSVQAYCYAANEDSICNYQCDKYATRRTVAPGEISATTGVDSKGEYVEEANIITHVVKKNETLKSIAKKYGVKVEDIRSANNLSSSKVKVGTKLTIYQYNKKYVDNDTASAAAPAPAKETAAPQQPAKQSTTKTNTQQKSKPTPPSNYTAKKTVHTVKSGESLDKIGKKYGVTAKQIMQANGLKSTTIHPGQKLQIPAKTTSKKK